MLGRPLLADARWPELARAGRAADIRPCIACNYCWGEINRGAPVGCSVNARLGREDELAGPPSPPPARAGAAPARHIVVVGAGPAGLAAAAGAARRGARVTLFAPGATLGGAARLHARLPGCGDIARALDWQERQVVAAGVTIRRNQRASAAAVLALRPDAVVLATGATPAAIEGLESDVAVPDLRALAARLLDRPERIDGTAVIFDHDHTPMTYDAALLLARMAARVVILTPRESVARDMSILVAQAVQHRLAAAGIAIEPCALPRAFFGGRLSFAHALTGRVGEIADVALLVAATPRIANDALAAPFCAAGIPVSLVGDAWAPRSMLWAVREGHEAAEALVPATGG
ncbi:MAG: FAD-dependent oxidoreductase [Alphaproteobacteria bacterium]|nr:FAD-dependent oxidoreductase [Alphaproteobacteria bacterium]